MPLGPTIINSRFSKTKCKKCGSILTFLKEAKNYDEGNCINCNWSWIIIFKKESTENFHDESDNSIVYQLEEMNKKLKFICNFLKNIVEGK